MKLASLLDGQKRDRYISIVWKRLLQDVRHPRESKPIFVFGKQRSGTSMLMYAFHRHPGMLVYDEHRNSRAFLDYQIRSFDVVNEMVRGSRFPAICFKPICDSHRILEFEAEVPGAHHIWLYRDYRDVANSSVRKFAQANRAIRLICERKPGGGWLQDGVTPAMQVTLSELYREGLSEFDLACLVWWVRNLAIVESGLLGASNVTVIKYETLVTEPVPTLRWLFQRMDVPFHERVSRRISPRSIRRNPAPPMNENVQELCDGVAAVLDDVYTRVYPAAKKLNRPL